MLLSTLNDPLSAIIAAVMGMLFAAVACAFIYAWIRELRKARATRSWPTVTGRIMTSHVHSYTGYDRRTHSSRKYYDPQVVYEYTINGTRYESHQIAIGIGYSDHRREAVERKVAPYKAGADVEVFYNPNDPTDAVLEHGIAGGILLLFIGVFILFILALFFIPWNRIF